ncbi:MAG: ABC transporter substrate-binding protein [Candidatus Liptonbacteria bacterium]|nr:ABC transporter substrate-binding protein [Candidatus Liptonbacteria bacterium]
MAVVLCVMLALAVAPQASFAQTPSPSKQLDDTFARVLAVVRDASLDAGTKEARVKELLASRLDYGKSAAMALGVHARANRARMHEFVPLFRKLLEKAYVTRIVGAAGEARLSVIDERIDGDYATVNAAIAFKQNDVRAAFRLHKTEQGWMVYDIIVEGISLLSNYRSQFHAIISKGSFDEVLERLREKTSR